MDKLVNQLAVPVGDLVSNLTFQSKTVTKSKLYQTEAARNLYPRYTVLISKWLPGGQLTEVRDTWIMI